MTRQAMDVFRKLVRIRPDDPYAQHNLAVSCFMLDRMDEGIIHCRRALKIKPEYPLALYNIALAYHRKGDVSRARRYVSKALELDPTDEHATKLAGKLVPRGFLGRLVAKIQGDQPGEIQGR
jgi:Flp pilus assembly protein TadD